MSTMDIFNFVENIKKYINETNKEDLNIILQEFKHGHFLHVLSRTREFRLNHKLDLGLDRLLTLLEATCYSQVGEGEKAADIIQNIYEKPSVVKSVDDLILYGNLAFMCDYKLARKIMSEAVKRIDNEPIKAAHAYFILGEAEENLGKFVRAIKYYKHGLNNLKKEEHDTQTILFYISNLVHFTQSFMKQIKQLNTYKEPLN